MMARIICLLLLISFASQSWGIVVAPQYDVSHIVLSTQNYSYDTASKLWRSGSQVQVKGDRFMCATNTEIKVCGTVLEMGVGLPKSACRGRLQTAQCCCVQKAWW